MTQKLSELNIKIAARLRSVRQSKKVPIRIIAEACGTTQQSISRIECGVQPLTMDWLERICTALEITPRSLFDDAAVSALVECEEFCAEITGLATQLQRVTNHVGRFLQYANKPSEQVDA